MRGRELSAITGSRCEFRQASSRQYPDGSDGPSLAFSFRTIVTGLGAPAG